MIINKKALDFKSQMKNLSSVYSMVLCAFFIALYIVLYYCNIKITPSIEFRPGYLAIAAAAMYGGPLIGMVVECMGDIISMLVTGGQGSSFFFGFTFSYALMGLLFGLFLFGGTITVVRAFAAAMVEFLISLFLNSYWLALMYYGADKYIPTLISRIPKCAIMLVISTVVLTVVMKALHSAFRRARLMPEYMN